MSPTDPHAAVRARLARCLMPDVAFASVTCPSALESVAEEPAAGRCVRLVAGAGFIVQECARSVAAVSF